MIRVGLLSLALTLLLLSQSALAQFEQVSFLPPTDDPEPVYGVVPAGGDGRVAFVYKRALFTADGTPAGTEKFPDVVFMQLLVPGPLGYIYYSNETDWKYFDPATNTITLIRSWNWGPGYSFDGYPLFSSSDKSYAVWRIPHYYQVYSFNPTTGAFQIENTFLDWPDPTPLEIVLFNGKVLGRSSLRPPGVSLVAADFYKTPSNLYVAPYMNVLFFAYAQPNTSTGLELWRTSDLVNYEMVADINPGPGNSNPTSFCDVPGVGLFFIANPTDNIGLISLFWTDGVHTVKRLHDWTVTPFNAVPIVRVGSRAVFIVTNGDGVHLWSSDGTVEGTIDLGRINDNQLASTGDLAFFASVSDEFGYELYQTDGTPAGTFRVPYETVPGPGNSAPSGLTPINGDIYFNAHTPAGDIQLFRYSPEHTVHLPTVIFDPTKQWKTGGVQYNWGGVGSCSVASRKAPSNLPLTDATTPAGALVSQSVFHVKVTTDFYGCGEFYPTWLDLTGAKEVRFWIQSTSFVKVEVEVDHGSCHPFHVDDSQDPCKTPLYLPSTQGHWKSVGIPLTDRPASEFAKTYSPFLITALEEGGSVSIANIIVVY